MRLCLEDRLQQQVPADHPLTSWLIEHVALLLNAQLVGTDGLTAWERARGRPFGMKLCGFCENVLWKQPPEGPQHDAEGNIGPRLKPGASVGYHRDSNSYRVMDQSGSVIKTRAPQSMPQEERWDPEQLAKITVTPWSHRAKPEDKVIEMGEQVAKHEFSPRCTTHRGKPEDRDGDPNRARAHRRLPAVYPRQSFRRAQARAPSHRCMQATNH